MLVNGSPSPLFRASRGLRQGDHLSPFSFFTIVVEALSGLLQKSQEGKLIEGFEVGRRT